jgi:regulator of replication initiation timing
MSEIEPKYYTKSELNHMLGEVEQQKRELFSEYEQMQQEIDDLKMENEILKERNILLRSILVDVLKGI